MLNSVSLQLIPRLLQSGRERLFYTSADAFVKNALANADILNRCKSLRDYMTFVNKVRNKTDVYEMDIKEAVTEAVDESINAYFDTYIIHRRKSLLLYSLYGV